MALFLNETVAPGLPDSTLCIHLLLVMCVVSYWFHHRPLSAPEGPSADLDGAKGRGSRRMFFRTCPWRVFEKDVDLHCSKTRRAWERRKLKMEKASRWTWEGNAEKRGQIISEHTERTGKSLWTTALVEQMRLLDTLTSIPKQCSPTQ